MPLGRKTHQLSEARNDLDPEEETESEPLKLYCLRKKNTADEKTRTGVVIKKEIFRRSQSHFQNRTRILEH